MAIDSDGFWYKKGKAIKIDKTHVASIIDNPATFGFEKKEIEELYKKYKEPMNFEGKAREELMKRAMDNGWVRVRKSNTRQGIKWIFQFDNFAKRKKELKDLCCFLLLDKQIMKKGDILHLLSYDGSCEKVYDGFMSGSINDFICEDKNEKRSKVELLTEFKYFNY